MLREVDPSGRPLFAALVADSVASRDGSLEEATKWDAESVVQYILQTEFDERWQPQGVDEQHLNLLALMTLVGSAPEAIVSSIENERLPSEINSSLFHAMTGFSVQDRAGHLFGLEPDMLGELFLLRRLEGGLKTAVNSSAATNATKQIMQLAYCLNPMATIACCGRIIRDFSDVLPVACQELQNGLGNLNLNVCEGIPSLIEEDSVDALSSRAALAVFANEFQQAITDYSAALDAEGATIEQKARALTHRASIHNQTRNHNLAVTGFTTAIELADVGAEQKADALNRRGLVYDHLEQYELAIADYSLVLRMDAVSSMQKAIAFQNRGVTHGKIGDTDSEIADFSDVLAISDAPPDQRARAFYNRGVTYHREGNYSQAIADYSGVLQMPHFSDSMPPDLLQAMSLTARGNAYREIEETDQAIADFEASLNLWISPAALNGRGMTHQQMGNHDLAIDDYSKVVNKDGFHDEMKAQAFFYRGVSHGIMGNHQLAIDDYSAVLDLDIPDSQKAQAFTSRGVRHMKLGNKDQAISDFSSVLGIDEAPAEQRLKAFNNRGSIYVERQEHEKAISDFSSYLEMEDLLGSRAGILMCRGNANAIIGNIKDAITDYSAVIEMGNVEQKAGAHINRGIYYKNMGKRKLAIADFTAVLAMKDADEEEKAHALYGRASVYYQMDNRMLTLSDLEELLQMAAVPAELRESAVSIREKFHNQS